jgi:hypothetical protein
MELWWRSSFGCCLPNRQVDDMLAELEFSLEITEDGGLTGSGEGTLRSEPVERCDDTDYGGIRTANPFRVTVKGTPTESGWKVQVTATDESEAYYTSSAVYFEQCVLCWVLPEFEGLGVTGTIGEGFSMPWDLRSGDTFRFEMDYHIPQEGCSSTNDHVGEGTLEILAVPG